MGTNRLKKPKLSTSKAKEKNITYSIKLYVSIEIISKNNGSLTSIVPKQKVLIGEIPLMTNKGTFIINGCERIIVNQLVRSPGVYYKKEKKKKSNFNSRTKKIIIET